MSATVMKSDVDLLVPRPAEGEAWSPYTVHTHFFGANVPEAEMGVAIYFRYQPTLGTSSGGVCIYRGMDNGHELDSDFLDYRIAMPWPEIGERTITNAVGVTLEFVEPGEKSRITFRSEVRDVSLDLEFSALTPLISRAHNMPGEDRDTAPESLPGGFEQIMHVRGAVVLDGERFDVDCQHLRDRSWRQVRVETPNGTDPWPPIAWSPIYVGPNLAMNATAMEQVDTDPRWLEVYDIPEGRSDVISGWMMTDGDLRPLKRFRRDVLEYHPDLHAATKQIIEFEDVAGNSYAYRGEAIAMTALPQWPNVRCLDSVYRWEGEDGEVVHNSVAEMFQGPYQRAMRSRRRARRS